MISNNKWWGILLSGLKLFTFPNYPLCPAHRHHLKSSSSTQRFCQNTGKDFWIFFFKNVHEKCSTIDNVTCKIRNLLKNSPNFFFQNYFFPKNLFQKLFFSKIDWILKIFIYYTHTLTLHRQLHAGRSSHNHPLCSHHPHLMTFEMGPCCKTDLKNTQHLFYDVKQFGKNINTFKLENNSAKYLP